MSLNSSSSSANDSSLSPNETECRHEEFVMGSLTVTKFLLLLPLCIFVLYLGYQRRRAGKFSTSDLLTYHMAVVELIELLGLALRYGGPWGGVHVGWLIFSFGWVGQMWFHILTCAERYLAVVHPITYMSLRTAGGVRIRNIIIGCVWLMNWCGVLMTHLIDKSMNQILILYVLFLALTSVAVSFCSLSVLCALIRPGPGDGGDKGRVDQSKLRAFYTIVAISGTLALSFLGNLFCLSLMNFADGCLLWFVGYWFNLPSSLVLPLLFLHRVGKLSCCKHAE